MPTTGSILRKFSAPITIKAKNGTRMRASRGPLWLVLPFWTVLLLAASCQRCPAQNTDEPELYGYEVVAEYPHDPNAFTQGFEYDTLCSGDRNAACTPVFWESTGMYGRSSMRLTDLETGRVTQSTPMDQQWFGEGATRLGDKLYQITWLTNQGFIYSIPDLKQVGTFNTPLKDGWGITTDGKYLVLSDGSDKITWINPADDFKTVKQISVVDGNKRIEYINEMEFIGGEVWANVWQSECIARICPETGKVKAWLLMHGLGQSLRQRNLASVPMDVLNGIAWDHQRQRLFVTGKQWPRVFEIVPQPLDATSTAAQQAKQSCYIKTKPL